MLPFPARQAELAGGLVEVTRPYGLSLADRACIAVAIERRERIYTTGRVWSSLPLAVPNETVR